MKNERQELADKYFDEGTDYYFEENFEEAIICFDKCLDENPKYLFGLLFKADSLLEINQPKEALKYFNKSIKYDVEEMFGSTFIQIAKCYYKLNKYAKASEYLHKSELSILDALTRYDDDNNCNKLYSAYLEKDDFFNEVIGSYKFTKKEKDYYKSVYIQSLRIIRKLHVDSKPEQTVAHYTRKQVAELLLFPERNKNNEIISNPCLQLNTIVTANDPKEGETLFDYLFDNVSCTLESSNSDKDETRNYQAFISCFTFNHDSLNQFRLYGKENGQEATGVSLVMKEDFFHSSLDIRQPYRRKPIPPEEFVEEENVNNNRLALFRCIYIDPVSQQVVSLGHRETYTFYRDGVSEDDIAVYHDDYKSTLQEVKDELNILKQMVNGDDVRHDVNPAIIRELLMNLRYLVKHVAFKEEQECRILDIVALDDDRVHVTADRMYIEYSGVEVAPNVKRVYFAPKTKGLTLFCDRLRHEPATRHISCRQSDHPFFTG